MSRGDSVLEVVNGLTQSGGGSFTISGSGTTTDGGGAITTSSPVSINNETGFGSSSSDGANPSLTTSGVVTFAAGDYTGAGIPITAGGFDTTASTTTTYPSDLTLTGDNSDLAGSLSMPDGELITDAGSSLTVPTGVDLSVISSTIDGAIITVESGGDYAAGDGAGTGTAISGGTLTSDSGASASTVDLSFSSGELNGPGSLTISGDFAWTGGTVSDSSAISLSQTGGGSFSISGSGRPVFDGGSISTTSPVSITKLYLEGDGNYGDSGTLTRRTSSRSPPGATPRLMTVRVWRSLPPGSTRAARPISGASVWCRRAGRRMCLLGRR